jgi:putative ABC transport system permease protein
VNPLDDLDDEIRDHIDRETQDNIDRGLAPQAARDAAQRKFGNVAMTREDARAVWIPVWIDQLLQDLRYALRLLRRSPGFSAVVIATLALGIGMNTAVFSVVNAVLLRPLSFPHPDRVIWMATQDPRSPDEFAPSVDVMAWREATSLERIVAYDEFDGRIVVNGDRIPGRFATVSGDFWELAGAMPEIGRVPAPEQSEVVLSRAFFVRAFGAKADIIGKPATVNGRPVTIVGVLPARFRVDLAPPPAIASLTPRAIEVYEQIVLRPPQNGMVQIFRAVGRLKPGVSLESARAELETLHNRTRQTMPAGMLPPRVRVMTMTEKLVGSARPGLMILLAAVGLVLLVGSANIASLLLARASARQKEIAIRAAVGAGRGRVVRQFLVESLLLSAAGGAAGLLVARLQLQVMMRLIPQAVPRLTEATLDGRVLLFTLAASVATAVLFGIGPALSLWGTRSYDVLKDGTRTVSATRASVRARTWLVVAELALTLVLLCGAGLLVRSLWRLTEHPPGFAPRTTLMTTVQYDTGGERNTEMRRRQFATDALARVRAVAGVESAGMTTNGSGRMRMFIDGVPPTVPNQDRPLALHSSVSEDYAKAIGMRLLRGRWVTDAEPNPVFVVNETLARRVFPDDDPIGKRIQVDGRPGTTEADGAKFAPIVGVVADLKYNRLETQPEPELFEDYPHANPFTIVLVARVAGDPAAIAPAIRAAVAGVDRGQTASPVETVEEVLAASIAPRRFTVFLFSTFAACALLLALVGIYGVIAYAVAQRTREIGVRMALGAETGTVVRMVVGEGMAIAAVGLAIGVGAALLATRTMTSLLYDVTPTDPLTFVAVVVGLALTVFAACCGPALRAARVDPAIALRSE